MSKMSRSGNNLIQDKLNEVNRQLKVLEERMTQVNSSIYAQKTKYDQLTRLKEELERDLAV